jgi:hypothetical protein
MLKAHPQNNKNRVWKGKDFVICSSGWWMEDMAKSGSHFVASCDYFCFENASSLPRLKNLLHFFSKLSLFLQYNNSRPLKRRQTAPPTVYLHVKKPQDCSDSSLSRNYLP